MGIKYVDVRPRILRGAVVVSRRLRLDSASLPDTYFREWIADQMAQSFSRELQLRYIPQPDGLIRVQSDLAIVSPDVAELLKQVGTIAVHTLE